MKKSIFKKIIYSVVSIVAFSSCLFSVSLHKTGASAEENTVVEKRYYDGATAVPVDGGGVETIYFTRKEEEWIEFPYGVPYYYTEGLSNACGPIAGACVIGYYDKYFEDLIPNYTTYYSVNGRYAYPDSTYIPAVIQELYTLMQTNVVDVGVSASEFRAGLVSYAAARNRTLNYSWIKTPSGPFRPNSYKNAMNNQNPVVLFANTINLYLIDDGETDDDIIYMVSSNSHVVVGFGYGQIKYYDESDVNFRTDTYLKVATGWDDNSFGYVKANDTSWLDESCVVYVA